MPLILLAVLAQTAPPLVQAQDVPAEPRVEHSQLGFTLSLGGVFHLTDSVDSESTGFAFHGRVGVRYALLSRAEMADRPNIAFSLLGGGDLDGSRLGAAFEGRLEGTVGGSTLLFEPTFSVFLSGGVQYLSTGLTPEYHLGGGANLDLLCTGIFDRFWGPATGGAAMVQLGMMFVLAPSIEFRYVMRGDGTRYNALMLSMGM